jgi:hypothetical protein
MKTAALTPAQEKTLDVMRTTIERLRRQGASEAKIQKHVEAWLLPYTTVVRAYMKNALLNPRRDDILDSDRCPHCSGQAYLTTFHRAWIKCLEGPAAGMYEAHCPRCGWRGHAPVEIARWLPRRAKFARR